MDITIHAFFLNIRDFGVRGDGQTIETKGIQKAIDKCAESGGGTIVFPSGTYLTGTLRLRSDVYLHLDSGATIKGSANIRDYYLNGELCGIFTAINARGITISGRGVIDGNGVSFIDMAKSKETGKYDPAMPPDHEHGNGPACMLDRPGSMLYFAGCEDIVINDINIVNAPFFSILFYGCDGVKITGLRIRSPQFIPNNDGINCKASRNIIITGCDILCGDDPIAISGVNDEAHCQATAGLTTPTGVIDNIIVSDCILSSRSAGVRIGYGVNDIQNCIFQNLVIDTSNRGLALFVREAGSIRNLRFSNIIMRAQMNNKDWWGNGEAIHISAFRQYKDKPLGTIEDIHFRGITAEAANGILIHGVEESVIKEINIEDLRLKIVKDPRSAQRSDIVDIRPALNEAHEWIEHGWCEDTKTTDVSHGWIEHETSPMYCQHVDGLRIRNTKIDLDDDVLDFAMPGLHCEFVDGLDSDEM